MIVHNCVHRTGMVIRGEDVSFPTSARSTMSSIMGLRTYAGEARCVFLLQLQNSAALEKSRHGFVAIAPWPQWCSCGRNVSCRKWPLRPITSRVISACSAGRYMEAKKNKIKMDLQAICLTVLAITRGSDIQNESCGGQWVNGSMDQWINR